jgi:DNA-binding CsgD family transcriptional regulator
VWICPTTGGLFKIRRTPLPLCLSAGIGFTVVMIEKEHEKWPLPEELRRRFGLTKREAEIALLLASGLRTREIAERLFISWHTARTHTEKTFRKLGVRARGQVAAVLLHGNGDAAGPVDKAGAQERLPG